MKQSTEYIVQKYIERHSFVEELKEKLCEAVEILETSYQKGGKLLICGNGGSCADASHIVGELMKPFRISRPLDRRTRSALLKQGVPCLAEMLKGALPAVDLGAQAALITAQLNDVGADFIYAQQVIGYGCPGDVLLGISTSGNSKNILYAGVAANAKGMKTIGLTGKSGGKMGKFFDVLLCAQAEDTEDIQDMHSVIYHLLCAAVENEFWGE